MSGFSRFVSYINLYEGSNKVRNVGFAKIEKRQGQCKIELHMKGCGAFNQACPVYLFARKLQEEIVGIVIGTVNIQNGTADFRGSFEEDNIAQSGHGFEDMGGLIILLDGTIMFASHWDEQEIQREKFTILEERQRPTFIPEEDAFAIERLGALSMDKNDIAATEAAVQRQVQRQVQLLEGTEEPSWSEKWKFILENYPVLTPFEEEEEILCVRIELKDLRLLPKRYWYLGNNSFLLHGFFNYRYLVLGAVGEKEATKWFIGVPGVFQTQEKVMAAIFGFPEYRSEKVSKQKTGQFGYWYRFMEE